MGKLTVHRHGFGFRLDGWHTTGQIGFYGAPDAAYSTYPRIGSRPRPQERPRWTPAAFCVPQLTAHIAPDVDCGCGWRVCASVADLAGLPPITGVHVSMQGNDDVSARPVVCEVSAWGPTLPGVHNGAPNDDPELTVRTTWLRLESRIWVHQAVSKSTFDKMKHRYPWAAIGWFADLGELAEGVDVDRELA